MAEDTKLKFSKIKLKKVLQKAQQMGLISHYDGNDYPEYIHGLWRSVVQQPGLEDQALAVENEMGYGDTIQLVSDMICELFDKHLEKN